MSDSAPVQPEASLPPGGPRALLEAMRPAHWIKNAFVVAPILFAGKFLDPQAWWRCGLAVVSFSLLSSAAYLVNDIYDLPSDRAHPDKRRRPIASGRLSLRSAWVAAAVLALLGLILAFAPSGFSLDRSQPLGGVGLAVWAGAYLVLHLLYSYWLKRYAIVDVILVALGFVLRAMAGAAAIEAPISPWLVICTFTLCLFLALSKRRSELSEFSLEQAHSVRRANRGYRTEDLDFMLTVSTALVITAYSLYCLAPRTVHRLGSAHMVWTIPLVVYGVFRFVRVSRRIHKGDVVNVLLSDRVLWLVVLAYVVVSVIVIRWGGDSALRGILDVGPTG